jgi:hypothetical protein
MTKVIFDYKKCRSEIFLQYGVDLDETSMSILFILLQEQNRQNTKQNELVEVLIKKVNNSQRSLELDTNHPRFQAFWFGAGKWGMAILLAILFAGTYYGYNLIDQKNKERLPALYLWYKNYYENTQGQSKKIVAEYLKNNPIPQ